MTSCTTLPTSFSLSALLSPRERRPVARDDEEVVASEIVRRRFVGFLGFLGVDARDFPSWRREVGDLRGRGGGRGERTHRFTLRPAMVISAVFWLGVPIEVIMNTNDTDGLD